MLAKTNVITQFELSNSIIDADLFDKIKLSPSARLVLIVLCRYYPNIYPCQKTIAKKTGLSSRSVVNALSELKQKGLILVECNHSNTYKFTAKIFELVKSAYSTRKNCGKHSENFARNNTNKKINNKPISYNYKNKNNKVVESIKYPCAESTRKLIKETFNIKLGSPLDMDKEQALKWLYSLPPILENSYYAVEVRKKWLV